MNDLLAKLELAAASSKCQYKMSAAITDKDRKVLSIQPNQPFQHLAFIPYYKSHCKTLHAEAAAILKVKDKRKLKGARLYVYRESGGRLVMSAPCESCMRLIESFGIKEVVHTEFNGWDSFKV